MSALAAALLLQMDVGYLHAFVHGLAHIIDGEEGGADGGEGFHLYPGFAGDFGGGGGFHGAVLRQQGEVYADAGEGQGVAEGNEVGGLLGSHNACQPGYPQHIALPGSAAGCLFFLIPVIGWIYILQAKS